QENLVEFDAVTAAALLWFAREACDIVCLETGLGGRLDSTNAVENTLVACITSIGMDHTELLGDTYSKIAAEKCGIFKNHCTVVCYPA
ncbi:MAG: bifunctional folylpolyglutamate synthase/dihydrofolate synthase, partial [Ruthenibacterium sp.]